MTVESETRVPAPEDQTDKVVPSQDERLGSRLVETKQKNREQIPNRTQERKKKPLLDEGPETATDESTSFERSKSEDEGSIARIRGWIREWWTPVAEVPQQHQWPVRVLETSDWLDGHFRNRVSAGFDRKTHIERGLGLVFTLIAPLMGLLGFLANNLAIDRSNAYISVAGAGIVFGFVTLVCTALCAARAWYGHAYAYGTPAFEAIRQVDMITDAFYDQGYEDNAHVLAQEELRDRMVSINAYSTALNHRVNNLRGIWLHRARTCLLLSGLIVILSVVAHICDTRLHETESATNEVEHVEGQPSQPDLDPNRDVRSGVGKPEFKPTETKSATVGERATTVRRDSQRQRGRQTEVTKRDSKSTAKAAKASKVEASKGSDPKKEAQSKARPEVSAVPAPSISIQLSEEAASSKDGSHKEIQNDSDD